MAAASWRVAEAAMSATVIGPVPEAAAGQGREPTPRLPMNATCATWRLDAVAVIGRMVSLPAVNISQLADVFRTGQTGP